MLNVQITALRKAYKAFQGQRDINKLLSDLMEFQTSSNKDEGKRGIIGIPPTPDLARANLNLICFDVVSGG